MADIKIKTNIGEIPLPEYMDIKAQQMGFDDYEDMEANGYYIALNEYEEVNDGWFTYYINKFTGEKKLHLDKGDRLITSKKDDFYEREFNF